MGKGLKDIHIQDHQHSVLFHKDFDYDHKSETYLLFKLLLFIMQRYYFNYQLKFNSYQTFVDSVTLCKIFS